MGRARKRRNHGETADGTGERWQVLAAAVKIIAVVVELLCGDRFPPRL